MLRGFYTAASGMLAQQRRTELLTNNMSNSNTTGYKADQLSVRSFPEMLISSMGGGNGSHGEQIGNVRLFPGWGAKYGCLRTGG
ncbi:flagellar basal body protein [Peribacillus frigoritolerans]|uniref:flagellar basal body protein n=1 Tax=Peribacillus frigoritolerans TaxID=450367 RepID=UPI003266BCCC